MCIYIYIYMCVGVYILFLPVFKALKIMKLPICEHGQYLVLILNNSVLNSSILHKKLIYREKF